MPGLAAKSLQSKVQSARLKHDASVGILSNEINSHFPRSQGNRHMESQPSKDQTKSPGRHRNAPLPNWYQLASWPFLTQPMGCGMAGGSLSLQSLCQKQALSMKRCLPTLYSFGFKEPQHRAADRTWIHWCTTLDNGIKSGEADAMVSSMVHRNCFNYFIHFQPQSSLWCFQHGSLRTIDVALHNASPRERSGAKNHHVWCLTTCLPC